ncbi:phage major capsid protein, P2 family [bacterium]|nr:phage major capsid protein, P2 family [bacterium]
MTLSIKAQLAFEKEMLAMAVANGFPTPTAAFAILPEKQQLMVKELQEQNNLLSRINVVMVDAKSGKKVFMGADKTGTYRGTRALKDLASNRATEYSTDIRQFDTIIPYARIDQWHHVGDLLKLYRAFYLQQMANETAAIALRGVARDADPGAQATEELKLTHVDLGFGAIMAQTVENGGNPDNVFDEWVPGSGCIIVGNTRTIPLAGITVEDNGDGTVTIPLANHGFVIGANVTIVSTTNYNGVFELEAASDAHNLVITSAYVEETLAGDAAVSQSPDFANIDHLVSGGIELIPELKLEGLTTMLARDVIAAEEQRLWVSQDPATPSEQKQVLETLKSYGGLTGNRILGMVAGSIWITSFNNLSYYELRGSRRKKSEQKEESSGYADWNYFEATNVVEDVEKMVVFNNVRFLRKYNPQ